MSKSGWIRSACLRRTLAGTMAIATSLSLAGCASGSFSTAGPAPSAPVAPQPANPPSLPVLSAPTPINTYIGTQIPGPAVSAPENTVSLTLNSSNSSYSYRNGAIPGSTPNPVPNSSGLSASWYDFWDLADTSGVTGLPGAQQYGLALEEPSRFSFFVSSSAQQIAALVPNQPSSCIAPTAPANYEYITLFGSSFLPATDTAYGTVELSASGSSFQFAKDRQYTESSSPATTGTIPFSTGDCIQSAESPALGHFIDIPATAANGNVEIRSFLGPTGLLVANLQGNDGSGNPLPLPGVLATIQPTTAIDLSQVTASSNLYRAMQYQPGGNPPAQYGYFGQSDSLLGGTPIVDSSGLNGGFQNPASPLSSPSTYSTAIVFGVQDVNNPGLFPDAVFVYQIAANSCPSGAQSYSGKLPPPTGSVNCASHAVAIVSTHGAKYVILVTGMDILSSSPTLLVLVQN